MVSIPLVKAPAEVKSLYKKYTVFVRHENGVLRVTITLLEEYEGMVIR